ncbi:hypothetical protein ACH5RR_014445 [Cinchona calisaya]|uniref:Uncharacterized protein n=1 Tax=Cinchona calisaya TaxID=153742 RepID=A0ABD3A4E3_9GENT
MFVYERCHPRGDVINSHVFWELSSGRTDPSNITTRADEPSEINPSEQISTYLTCISQLAIDNAHADLVPSCIPSPCLSQTEHQPQWLLRLQKEQPNSSFLANVRREPVNYGSVLLFLVRITIAHELIEHPINFSFDDAYREERKSDLASTPSSSSP